MPRKHFLNVILSPLKELVGTTLTAVRQVDGKVESKSVFGIQRLQKVLSGKPLRRVSVFEDSIRFPSE
jgi:hypothetical protein